MRNQQMTKITRLAGSLSLIIGLLVSGHGVMAAERAPVKDLLKEVCKSHASEPACVAFADLSQDEAFVILKQACRTDMSEPCKRFLGEQGGVLNFDVRNKVWEAWWEQKRLDLKFDVAGVPTLRLKPKDARPLNILVSNISPLAYSAKPGTPKEEDLAVVAGLKTFVSLVGTGVQALIQTASYSVAAGAPERLPEIGPLDNVSAIRPLGAPSAPPPAKPTKLVCKIPDPDVAPVAKLLSARNTALVDINSQIRSLETELDAVTSARDKYVRAIQLAEDGKRVAATELVAAPIMNIEKAYDRVGEVTQKLVRETDQLASCQPVLTNYVALLSSTNNRGVLTALVAEVKSTATACSVPTLQEAVIANAEKLTACAEATPPELETALKLHSGVMKAPIERLLNARSAEEKVWQALDKIRSSKEEVLGGVNTLNRQVQRGQVHTWNGTLLTELSVTRPNPRLGWSKVQSHSVVVKTDTPYAKTVSLSLGAEEKYEYKLESATGRILGYGIGVVYTPLQESTWSAVSVPGTTTKVIAETKRESRAGDLGAFLTYRFMEHWGNAPRVQPILEFGAAVNADHPAFFLGSGFELFRAARVGIGWSPQRVSVLSPSQTANETVVASNDDIKTERRFDTSNWYVSFAFALDSLTLFSSK
jgi:hypothetical protein